MLLTNLEVFTQKLESLRKFGGLYKKKIRSITSSFLSHRQQKLRTI